MHGTANPQELAVLQQVYDEHCAAAGMSPDDPEREFIANEIMLLFGQGMTSAAELRRALALITQQTPNHRANGESPAMFPQQGRFS
jgi:hypothetical protein